MRPADVEGWLSGLGLTPAERADRDGIASWDLVLDGRRRFDLRITVILDPALALICWAHYAPPISDMFRKSYRRLLRWNDEFPFAKFSVADDERPLLAVEIPIEEADADALGHGASPGSSASPTGSSTNRRTGCGSVAGCPTWATGRLRQRGVPRPVRGAAAGAAGAGDVPEATDATDRPRNPPSRRHSRARRVSRRLSLLLLAVVAATGLLATPLGSAEVRAATPDLTIVGERPLRRPAPGSKRVRVTVDLVMTNHLRDTKTKRYYFDRAFLSVLPDASGVQAHLGRSRGGAGGVSKKTSTYTLLQLNLGRRIYSGKTNNVPARLRPRRRGRRGIPRCPGRDVPRLVPGLGVRHRLDPGELGQGHLPGRLRGRGRGGRDPGADDRGRRDDHPRDAASSTSR